MITALDCARLAHAIYAPGAEFSKVLATDNVVVGLARVGDTDVIALRGSVTAGDWIADAEALPVWHSGLGFVHAGFIAGMDDVFNAVRGAVGPKVAITGHSLGGARARLLAALYAVAGLPVEMLCVFGSPKPGFANVARVIQKSGMPHYSYRNRNDVVPLMAAILPFWAHTEDWVAVSAAPATNNLEPLRDHSSALYVEAIAALQP